MKCWVIGLYLANKVLKAISNFVYKLKVIYSTSG